jgi:hypothetical protein
MADHALPEWQPVTDPALCTLGNLVVGIDGTSRELCESIGGNINQGLQDLWMGHLWQVPGWENPWGLFAAENPRVNAATSEMWLNRNRSAAGGRSPLSFRPLPRTTTNSGPRHRRGP